MLPRAKRLRADRDVRRTLTSGLRRQSQHFAVRIRPSAHTRFAFVISKQVSKLAVKRNLLRRRLRALAAELPMQGQDVVVIARPSALQLTFQQLRTELHQLFTHVRPPRPRSNH